jgi:CheY-like chemotaxis protein
VTIASQLESGTSVTMFLPRTNRPLSEISTAVAEPPGGGETVLLVEDNLEVQETVAMLLDQLGYRVFRARSAAAALQLLKSVEALDLVFSDIIMPGELDGVALARQVKEEYPDIAVLLTSGYAKTANTQEAGFPILRKPYQLATLARAIRDALDSEPARLLT